MLKRMLVMLVGCVGFFAQSAAISGYITGAIDEDRIQDWSGYSLVLEKDGVEVATTQPVLCTQAAIETCKIVSERDYGWRFSGEQIIAGDYVVRVVFPSDYHLTGLRFWDRSPDGDTTDGERNSNLEKATFPVTLQVNEAEDESNSLILLLSTEPLVTVAVSMHIEVDGGVCQTCNESALPVSVSVSGEAAYSIEKIEKIDESNYKLTVKAEKNSSYQLGFGKKPFYQLQSVSRTDGGVVTQTEGRYVITIDGSGTEEVFNQSVNVKAVTSKGESSGTMTVTLDGDPSLLVPLNVELSLANATKEHNVFSQNTLTPNCSGNDWCFNIAAEPGDYWLKVTTYCKNDSDFMPSPTPSYLDYECYYQQVTGTVSKQIEGSDGTISSISLPDTGVFDKDADGGKGAYYLPIKIVNGVKTIGSHITLKLQTAMFSDSFE